MANGKIRFGKQSGGELALVIPDGASNTEVIVPESGSIASVETAVTDNSIARYDGTTGKLQDSSIKIDDSGNLLLTSGTGALGYGAGAGGTVTQLTSKSTTVTLNKPCGRIIMSNSSLGAGASVTFALNNNSVQVGDTSIAISTNGNYEARSFVTTSGVVYIKVINISGGSLSDSLVVNFVIIRGSNT